MRPAPPPSPARCRCPRRCPLRPDREGRPTAATIKNALEYHTSVVDDLTWKHTGQPRSDLSSAAALGFEVLPLFFPFPFPFPFLPLPFPLPPAFPSPLPTWSAAAAHADGASAMYSVMHWRWKQCLCTSGHQHHTIRRCRCRRRLTCTQQPHAPTLARYPGTRHTRLVARESGSATGWDWALCTLVVSRRLCNSWFHSLFVSRINTITMAAIVAVHHQVWVIDSLMSSVTPLRLFSSATIYSPASNATEGQRCVRSYAKACSFPRRHRSATFNRTSPSEVQSQHHYSTYRDCW